MRPSNRAISTVLDVGLALVLISASVVMIGFYLNDNSEPADPHRAEETSETIASTSLTIQFDRSAVASSDRFTPPENNASELYTQTHYGSGTGLLADAAVTNAKLDGTELFGYGEEYEDSVDAALQGAMTGSNTRFYAIARWEPYEGSSLFGNATAGEYPPPTADVSSTTITVRNGMDLIDQSHLAGIWIRHGHDPESAYTQTSEHIADRIVTGLFPPERTQYALESQGMNREMTVYQYLQMANATDGASFDPTSPDSPLSWPRDGTDDPAAVPDAAAANEELKDALAGQIEDELRAGDLGPEIEDALSSNPSVEDRRAALEDIFAESIAVGEVQVTVQTWNNE